MASRAGASGQVRLCPGTRRGVWSAVGRNQLAYHPCCVRQETRATKCDEIDESGHRVGKGLIKIGLGFGRSQYHDCALIVPSSFTVASHAEVYFSFHELDRASLLLTHGRDESAQATMIALRRILRDEDALSRGEIAIRVLVAVALSGAVSCFRVSPMTTLLSTCASPETSPLAAGRFSTRANASWVAVARFGW